MNLREVQLSLAGQALSLIYTPPQARIREKSGLIRDNAQPWASGRTRPAPPIVSDPEEIRRLSSQRYGQALSDIEAGFAELLHAGSDDVSDIGAPRRRRTQP
ncbi:hypothetical protein [Mycolicibacterium grossiae]|uniref:hypothetical protein n=1 Tax=Mycolicibacterium grossiae TaxID=1552759 RepID=UPI000AB6993A|nr:hypothetical protein [Mycolicibacterium grossiae]